MSHKSRVVTSTACPVSVTRPAVTVSCPAPTTVATTLPATTTVPTTAQVPTAADLTAAGVPGVDTAALQALANQLGLGAGLTPTAGVTPAQLAALQSPLAQAALLPSAPQQIFNNPVSQLGALSPFASLAATNPSAALAAISPALAPFNPALNPAAAFLQFNPAAAPTLALSGKGFGKGFGKPFGKGFGKFGI